MILHGEVEEAGKMNQTLLDELKDKEATIKDLQTSVNALRRGPDVDGLETMQELKERLEEYKLYLQQAKDTIEHLENTNSALQETNTTLESEKENLAEEVYTLKRQLNDLEDLNETIKALKKKNKQLEAQLREVRLRISVHYWTCSSLKFHRLLRKAADQARVTATTTTWVT